MSNKNKNNNSQVIMKTDTSENWAKCEDKYIPAPFTIIIYQDGEKAPKIKISDGVHKLSELEFINTNNAKYAPTLYGDTLDFS